MLGPRVRDEIRARRGRPLREVVFGIVDLETTGISADARILEIGLVVQRGRVRGVHTLEALADLATPGRSARTRRIQTLLGRANA